MKYGLIDADLLDKGTNFPNLALMKISGWLKEKGHTVKLIEQHIDILFYEKIYLSKVFSATSIPDLTMNHKGLIYGGTGFDDFNKLNDEIEHHMPDYHLYDDFVNKKIANGDKRSKYKDYLDCSIGYTTRGCFRKCEFCVNKKYDRVYIHSPVHEFYDKLRKRIILLDDNVLGFPNWEKIIDEVSETGVPFKYKQGLDIRLMTEKKAKKLSKSKYYGEFIFAFDSIEDKDIIEKSLKVWSRFNSKIAKFYVLCGFDQTKNYSDKWFVEDIKNTFKRIKILMKYKAIPYIMRYRSNNGSPYENSKYRGMYINIASWVNQPSFFKKMTFREFIIKRGEGTIKKAATVRYMEDFENDFPNIASEYFDIRYGEGLR